MSVITQASPLSRPQGKRQRRRWEAADTVVASSVVLVAGIVAVFVFLCFQGYDTTIEQTRSRAERAAGVIAEGSRWVVSATLAALQGAATQLADGVAPQTVQAGFERAAASLPVAPGLHIYSTSGDLIPAGSAAQEPAAPTVSGADYFEAIRSGRIVSIGYQEGAGESASFSVAQRVERNGSFAGAVVATLPASILSQFALSQDLGPGSTVSVIRADGWIIAREPPLAKPLNLAGTAAMDSLAVGQAGSYVSPGSPADGVARVVGFRHVDGLGYIAVASISRATALAGLWYSIWVVSLLLAPVALALLIGSLLTARVLRRAQASSRSLAEALDRNEQLFREIHHRVKNNLQSVNALLQMHAIPREVRAELGRRIFAMSAVHEHIYRSGDFSDVRVKDYLHTLIAKVRAGANPDIEVVEEIEDVVVDKDAAGPLGLILNEVLSNCFKHAFPVGRAGTVKVSLARAGDGLVRLSVEDNGVGFDPAAPGTGIGRKLVAGFAQQLGGEVSTVSASGSTFTLVFPGK
ncbi:histidine kinase dimerization/phosphoacceptor domain -containing protein [Devosia sp.]|uniref:sensor histidine kinase n=1 Tax=Devosia sp. TaxID=1871048 RepID=UPI001AD25B2B|nr:histidine kinase dimerization/phosphoacceptor domain -containing protein [Devosia sp.]MBN9309861.1 hypothetical protein [Devosia sp.]